MYINMKSDLYGHNLLYTYNKFKCIKVHKIFYTSNNRYSY